MSIIGIYYLDDDYERSHFIRKFIHYILITESIVSSTFFFISILIMNPCGLFLTETNKC